MTASPVAANEAPAGQAADHAAADQAPAGQAAAEPLSSSSLAASVTALDAAEETVSDFEAIQEVATRYQNGALSSREFIDLLGATAWGEEPDSWGEGADDWGSSQYQPIREIFRAFCALKVAGLDPAAVIGWGSSAEIIPAPVPLPEALAKIAADLAEYIQESARENYERLDTEALAAVGLLAEATCLDPAFESMKERSWDLWHAASHAAHVVFNTYDFNPKKDGENDDSDGYASDARPLVRDVFSVTAFQCYALVQAGYIQNPDEAFNNFDT